MRDSDDLGSNPTTNTHLDDLIRSRVNRRQVLGGGVAAAAVGFFGRGIFAPGTAAAAPPARTQSNGKEKPGRARPLGFTAVPPSTDDTVHVPEGYLCEVLIPWGTPLFADSPAWLADASNTAADQAKQVGFNHDGMHYFPLGNGPKGSRRGLLVLNHEYTDANQIYTAAQGSTITDDAAGREKVAKALAAHGVTVVEIYQAENGEWKHVQGSWFIWDVFLYAGDPAYPELSGPNVPADQPAFGSPDGIWVDPDGLVWIQTDISNSSQNLASRNYDNIGNNQMLVANPDTGEIKRFLTGPRGCEITGVITTPDQSVMFVNVQHPGESTNYWNAINGAPTVANPRTVSNWPDHAADGRPRPGTLVIRRADGGKIGS